jgi:hypothetical protein
MKWTRRCWVWMGTRTRTEDAPSAQTSHGSENSGLERATRAGAVSGETVRVCNDAFAWGLFWRGPHRREALSWCIVLLEGRHSATLINRVEFGICLGNLASDGCRQANVGREVQSQNIQISVVISFASSPWWCTWIVSCSAPLACLSFTLNQGDNRLSTNLRPTTPHNNRRREIHHTITFTPSLTA